MNQDESFAKHIGSDNFLDLAIDWIKRNKDPEDVFDDSALSRWANRNEYIQS